jgi:hypothetical protein
LHSQTLGCGLKYSYPIAGDPDMTDELKNGIHTLRGLYETGINRIAGWNQLIPGMQLTMQNLVWIDETINRAPSGINVQTSERLMGYIDMATQEAHIFRSIPDPDSLSFPSISASGTAVASEYYRYVNDVGNRLHDDPEIARWSNVTLTLGNELILNQDRTGVVHQRLVKLNPVLGNLHDQAIASTRAAEAGTQSPVEAAANQNRLLEQFKGALIARCKAGKGTNYTRISDNLAANSPLTQTVVADGQNTYDTLNDELVDIRKSIKPSTGRRMGELLKLLEDHITVITDALDPSKVGVNFRT